MIPIKVDLIDFKKISNREYFYSVKKKFLLHDFRYKNIETEPKIDFKQNKITMFLGDSDDAQVQEIKLDFFEDYLKTAVIKSALEYKEAFLKELESIKNYSSDAVQNHFSHHEMTIKAAISSINLVAILKSNMLNEFIESELQSILDEINTIKQNYFNLPKIHLNLNKVQALLLFNALLENNLIVGCSTSDMFRMVEDYFTYRDENENLPIENGRKALSDYLTSQKKISNKSLSDLEKKLDDMIGYLNKKFGE